MIKTIYFVIAIFLQLAVGNANAQLNAAQPQGPSEWTSAPCTSLALGPSDDISHLQRIYLLGADGHTTQYKFFADAQCVKPMYSFVFKGKVEIGIPVQGIADTIQAVVSFEKILFTLDSPRGEKAASQCADGKFAVGVRRDVSDTNCLFMKPVKSCGLDYDIVRIKHGMATPGFRTADMCKPEGRPMKLQTIGAKFLEQF